MVSHNTTPFYRCLNTWSLNLSNVWNLKLGSKWIGSSDISWPSGFQCQNWDTLVDTGAEQRHSDANFPPARNPRITAPRRAVQIEKLIQFCGNVSGNTPSFLNIYTAHIPSLHLHHGSCLHEMVKVMQTLTFSPQSHWFSDAKPYFLHPIVRSTFNSCSANPRTAWRPPSTPQHSFPMQILTLSLPYWGPH